MALKLADRVVESSTSTGTGAFTLSGAQTGYQSFSSRLSNGDTTYYTIQGKNGDGSLNGEWEVGVGTYTSGSLSRDTVLESSNSDNLVNFSAGNKDVFIDLPSEKVITTAGTGISISGNTITNTLPDQVVSLTGAGTTTVTGTYPSFTITSTGGAGGGDVTGPSSSTDNAITRFDGTTGKLIQNSVVTISDTGDIAGAATITDINYVDFNTGYSTTLTEGQLGWDGNNTLGLGMAGGNVIQHIGEDQFFYCKATSAITKGQVVMFTGAVGASGVPTGAPATGVTDGTYIMGIAAESIALNGFGLIQTFGTLRNVNTSGYSDGDILWYNPSVTGGLTNTKPSAPNVKVQMAAVINGGSSGGGTILIRIDPGSVLGGSDSNVQFSTLANGQTIIYDNVAGYWKNATLTAGTGISISNGAGSITITNSSPDQTVAISGTAPVSVTGTYPNFTVSMTQSSGSVNGWLSSTDWTTFNSKQTAYTNLTSIGSLANATGWLYNNGTGTFSYSTPTAADVGAVPTSRTISTTAPLAGGGALSSNLTLSMPAASGSQDGYLTSNDWTTFNSKGSGTVTSVSGTGSVNGITLTGTVTSSGSLTLGGTLSGIGNSQLTNSSITVNGTSIALGASGTITANTTNALSAGTGLSFTSGTTFDGSAARTLNLADTTVTAGSYTNANITVDAQGRITTASNGSGGMVYPGAGIAVSTGSAWGTSLTAPTGAIVGTTDTQTLTNKTLTNPTINGFTGNTDVINIGSGQFYKNASGNIGIGTTSPSYKLDIQNAGTFTGMSIGNTTTSGLTNLFIYNTVNTLTYGVSSGGSYMSYTGTGPLSFSAGGSDLFVFTQAGAFGVGGANYGTSGQVLTSQGSSSAPIWSSVGSMTLLGTLTTTSGSSQTLSSLTLTSYKQLYIVFDGVSASSTSANLRITDPNATNLQIGTFSTTNAALRFVGLMTLDLGSGVFTCTGYRGAAATGVSSGDASNSVFGGISTYSTSSTSITFTVSTGSFDAGAIDIYGVK